MSPNFSTCTLLLVPISSPTSTQNQGSNGAATYEGAHHLKQSCRITTLLALPVAPQSDRAHATNAAVAANRQTPDAAPIAAFLGASRTSPVPLTGSSSAGAAPVSATGTTSGALAVAQPSATEKFILSRRVMPHTSRKVTMSVCCKPSVTFLRKGEVQ